MTERAGAAREGGGPAANGQVAGGQEAGGPDLGGPDPDGTDPSAGSRPPDGDRRQFDLPRIERAIREILAAIGEDPDRDGLRNTPARVARAYAEQFAGLRQRPQDVLTTMFDADHDEMVLVRDIEVYGTCEHHLVPFIGVAHIGYIPNEKGQITGLSKLARLVDVYARRPQVQERMTSQIADALVTSLEPRGVVVVIEAEHLCMTMRGVRKPGARTVTSAVRGAFRDSNVTRAEAMSLIYGRH
jgi:GTP cyclohydrolase I